MMTARIDKDSKGKVVAITTTYGCKGASIETPKTLAEAIKVKPYDYFETVDFAFPSSVVAAYNDAQNSY